MSNDTRWGERLASFLRPAKAPDSLWLDIQKAAVLRGTRPRRAVRFTWAALAAALVMAGALVLVRNSTPAAAPWEVTTLRGNPQGSELRPGQSLQTDGSSQARVKIANIGQLTLEPNTKIRLIVTRPDQHRIALDRGKVEAATWAPPRLFVVDTPAASAVDLGCRYTLEVQDDGGGLLHVTLGLVALEREGRETIVPAGAFCRTRSGAGPETPFYEDSSRLFQSALNDLDSGRNRSGQLQILLREARVRDGLSLWHLLPRVDTESRGLIYDRLAELLPPPAEVTRNKVIAMDPRALDLWKNVVSQLWK